MNPSHNQKICTPRKYASFKNLRYIMPQNVINEILLDLELYSDYRYSLNNKLNYISLVNKLNYQLQGYKSMYKDTTNFLHFRSEFNRKKEEVKRKLLEDILGKTFFSLTKTQKAFLGLI